MKKLAVIVCWAFCFCAQAQTVRTIVPAQPITAGTAFQVQYIITGNTEPSALTPPPFDSLVLVSGPHRYKGLALIDGKQQPIQNISYTLMTAKMGRLKIGGLKAQFRNLPDQQSNEASILVIPAPKASFHASSSYTDVDLYSPPAAADHQKLMRDNLFVLAKVDKKTCYVGEPVTVVFTLYSRLQSTSEVVNSPSLYGFSVIDMLDIRQSHNSIETIKNQVYNTSVLRKMQLYPGQSGQLTIDSIDLQNSIEFGEPDKPGHKKTYDYPVSSQPVAIQVKALPEGQPENYTGAVGQFGIEASLPPVMKVSATGELVVTIRGAGNFLQFAPPSVSWPPALEALDPVISDSLNIQSVPEEGSRSYTYRFTADSAGVYHLPPVVFSFFNPAIKQYQTVSTDSLLVQVQSSEGKKTNLFTTKANRHYFIWVILLLFIGLAGGVFYFYQKRKKKILVKKDTGQPKETESIKALYDLPAQQAGMELSKILHHAERSGRIAPYQKKAARELMDECQLLAYADLATERKKEELITRALVIVNSE